MKSKLAWNPHSSCFSLLSAGITGMYHHTWLHQYYFFWVLWVLQQHTRSKGTEILLILLCAVLGTTLPPAPITMSGA
jgi:hypothetical protein